MRDKDLVRAVLVFVILCALFGAACSGRQGPADDAREHVSVEDFTYSLLPGGARVVMGKLYNPTSQWIRNAQIQIGLYDGDNRLVTTMSVVVRNIEPGQFMPFRKTVDEDVDIQGAKVRSVLVP